MQEKLSNKYTFAMLISIGRLDIIDAAIETRFNKIILLMDYDGMWLWLFEAPTKHVKDIKGIYG